jgi:hypothetical protein
MDHREGVFGECQKPGGELDLGRFAERLLLFDRVALRSNRLLELNVLCGSFGVDAVVRMLNEGTLTFDANAYGIGSQRTGPLSYEIKTVIGKEHRARSRDFLHEALRAMPNLRAVQREKVGNAVERGLVDLPCDFGAITRRNVRQDLLGNLPSVHASAVLSTSRLVGMRVRPEDVTLKLYDDGDKGYGVETNLLQLGLSEEQTNRVVEGALHAVAETEKKLEQMQLHRAIAAFREDEKSVLEAKINFSFAQLTPEGQQARLARVLRIAGLPDFDAAARGGALDYRRLLEIRASDECIAFRRWLRSVDDASDEEIEDQISGIRTKLAAAARGVPGKTVRVMATSGIGFIPIVGPIAGIAAGALDTFLVEKVLPKPGPAAFLDNEVRSILGE